MSDNGRMYYRIKEGSPLEQSVKRFKKFFNEVRDEWWNFTKKHGANSMYAGNTLQGLLFENGVAPIGWKSTQGLPANVFRPLASKAPDAYREFQNLQWKPDGRDLGKEIGIDSVFAADAVYHPGFKYIGDECCLSLYEGSEVPEGATLIKMSEYWAAVEADEAKEAN